MVADAQAGPVRGRDMLPVPGRHRRAGLRKAQRFAGKPAGRRVADDLGGNIVAVFQKVAHKTDQRSRAVARDLNGAGRPHPALRVGHRNAMFPGKFLKHMGGDQSGTLDRHPHGAAAPDRRHDQPARRRAVAVPDHAVARPGSGRRDPAGYHVDGHNHPVGLRIDPDPQATVGPGPTQAQPVEIQRQRADSPVIADIVVMGGADLPGLGKQAVVIEETAAHPLDILRFQRPDHRQKVLGVQFRVAAADQNQVAVQDAALHGPGPVQARDRPMLRSQDAQRHDRRRRLDGGGRGKASVRVPRRQERPCRGVDGDISHAAFVDQKPLEQGFEAQGLRRVCRRAFGQFCAARTAGRALILLLTRRRAGLVAVDLGRGIACR